MRRTMTVSQLKTSWTTAQAKARLNWARSPICVMDTIVFVTEVPMLAPITIGIAVLQETSLFVGRGSLGFSALLGNIPFQEKRC